ncbi:hypothetical protein HNP32_002772 [Brevundimonas bullata]|uniref:Lipoprotein n=1 Tax=Brevundimonas bullata TaxID=13160 RepID=A0A7W7IRM9_9CAUL|nr:hypothetical protein [Brevundimonas bullata]MBB4799018.1 hypothetical protein [Brevundimonas bullata]MBB6383978.1 hypothetical protein [Brevundimonas bullata]
MRAAIVAILFTSLIAACSADSGLGQQAVPANWRAVAFDPCCTIHVPPTFREVPKPSGVRDPSFIVVGNDATEIVFEYRPQVSFPEGPLGQQDWSQDRMKVDGQEADLVSYAATDAFVGGRTLRMRARRPEAQTHQSAPTPARGMELGATANCRTDADCDVARRVFSLINFSDSPG